LSSTTEVLCPVAAKNAPATASGREPASAISPYPGRYIVHAIMLARALWRIGRRASITPLAIEPAA
jgi:hypothetical protein